MSVKCTNCGTLLDDNQDPPDGRLPCPKCGSTHRVISVSIHENVVVRDHLAMEQERDGERIGFTETPREELASFGFRDDLGRFRFGLTGKPPRGEQDTLRVCATLVRRLNHNGATWSTPEEGDNDVDCISFSKPGLELRIQVVRALSDPTIWNKLADTREVRGDAYTAVDLADDLRSAIEHKASRIPRRQREDLVLALDATRLPAHALDGTVAAFREEHGQWASDLGFQEVWVVGPSLSLTSKLCYADNAT